MPASATPPTHPAVPVDSVLAVIARVELPMGEAEEASQGTDGRFCQSPSCGLDIQRRQRQREGRSEETRGRSLCKASDIVLSRRNGGGSGLSVLCRRRVTRVGLRRMLSARPGLTQRPSSLPASLLPELSRSLTCVSGARPNGGGEGRRVK